MNSAQRKIAAIACWAGAIAIVTAYAANASLNWDYEGDWLKWLGSFHYRRQGLGGLWAIFLAALGAIAWTARGSSKKD